MTLSIQDTQHAPTREIRPNVQASYPAPKDVWRELLASDPDALPDQVPEWIDAICSSGKYEDASTYYELDDGRRFVLPLVRRLGLAGVGEWLSSFPPAWGIGGLIGPGSDTTAVSAVVDHLRERGVGRLWIRPNPLRGDDWQHLSGPDVTFMPRRAHVLDLSDGADAVYGQLSPKMRWKLRRAARAGVRVEVDRSGDLLPTYYQLYMSSVERWSQHQHEPHRLALWRATRRDPLSKLQALSRHLGDSFVVLVAFVNDKPAAGDIVLLGPRTAHHTRGAMDHAIAAPAHAAKLAQWHAIKVALAHGCTTYHLGESGSSPGISHFKEQFGAVPFSYPEVRIERIPYTQADLTLRRVAKKVLRFQDTRAITTSTKDSEK